MIKILRCIGAGLIGMGYAANSSLTVADELWWFNLILAAALWTILTLIIEETGQ